MSFKQLIAVPFALALFAVPNAEAAPKINVDTHHQIEGDYVRIYGVTCIEPRKCIPNLFINVNCKTFDSYRWEDKEGFVTTKVHPDSRWGQMCIKAFPEYHLGRDYSKVP